MTAALELKHVRKDFDGVQVLQGVDLSIARGERHAIIGPNGAGKTTLINVVSGKFAVSSGTILLGGVDITSKPAHAVNRLGLSRSFQIINFFPEMTVFENLRNGVLARHGYRFGLLRRIDKLGQVADEAMAVTELVGLGKSRDRVAGELPYGDQRALEIGLSLAAQPEVILLDEPAAGMSTAETLRLIELIANSTKGRTLVLVEHDMNVVFSLADRISVLHYGKILAQGTPQEIRANPEVKASYLGKRG